MVLKYALLVTVILMCLAAAPTAYVALRETWLRIESKRLKIRLDAARRRLGDADEGRLRSVIVELKSGFGAEVLERALLLEIAEPDTEVSEERARMARQAFAYAGLFEEYERRVQSAKSWAGRAHAAKVLGLLGDKRAAQALVGPLRDAHEDVAVKSAAAAALARLNDETVLPVLVEELGVIDEHAAPIVADAVVAFGPPACAHLIPLLDNARAPATRVWSARLLGRIGDPIATEPLMARLRDRQDLLRIAVVEALGHIGDRRALQDLIQATLRDPAGQVRAHAAGAIAKIEKERVQDVLVSALADPDYATRARALEAFESISLRDTTVLENAMRDPNWEVRKRAALALERAGYLDRVVTDLAHEDPTVQAKGYAAFIELGRAGLADSLTSHLNHESFQVRVYAAQASAELGAKQAAVRLLPALDDPSWPVRAAVATAIGRLRLSEAAGRLIKVLGDDNESVQEAAADALTTYAASDLNGHVAALVAGFERGNAPVRLHIALIAARLDAPEMTRVLIEGSTDPSEMVRLAAVNGLARRPDERVVTALVARLTDPSVEVRLAAVGALGTASSDSAFGGLLRALPEAPPRLRDRIADSLAEGGRGYVFEHIEELLRSPDGNVQLGLAWTLGKLQQPESVPFLARQLASDDPKLRASAAGALGRIHDPAAIQVLLDATGDVDVRARAAVTNALGKIGRGDPRAATALTARLRDPDAFIRDRAAVCLSIVAPPGEVVKLVLASREVLSRTAVTTALVCAGDESAMKAALSNIAEPGHLEQVQSFLLREGDAVRTLFFGRLGIEPPTQNEKIDSVELVDRYTQVLRSSLDVKSRRTAIEALSRMRGVRILQILVDALIADPQEPVRVRAAEVLSGMMNEEPARQAMLKAVSDPIPDVACIAIRALRTDLDPKVASTMFTRLGTASADVRDALEDALSNIHKHDPRAFFDRMMGVDAPALIAAALGVVRRFRSEASIPLLVELAKSVTTEIRVAAARALADIETPAALTVLEPMLDDVDAEVRAHAVEGLCRARDVAVLMKLTRVRRDPSVRVRGELAAVLGVFARTASARLLDTLAEDPAPEVRARAMVSFICQKEVESLERFETFYARADIETKHAVVADPRAPRLTHELHDLIRARPEVRLRQLAVVAISALAQPHMDASLLPALMDPAPAVRLLALTVLSTINDERVRDRIRELCRDPDEAVRALAAKALGEAPRR
jgi:HEAT repeat protein